MDSASYHKLIEHAGETSQTVELSSVTAKNSDSRGHNASKQLVATVPSAHVENSVIIAKFVVGSEPHITLTKSTRKVDDAKLSNLRRNLFFIVVATVAVIIAAIIVLYVTVFETDDSRAGELEKTVLHLGNGVHIFTRNEWGGVPMRPGYENRTFSRPRNFVIITHTASIRCMSVADCSRYLQSKQENHIATLDYVDIGYNFLVGGEGGIYQALGWDVQNYVKNNSILIAFIGNYGIEDVSDMQRLAVQTLLDRGVELGKLDKDYIVVGHRQVAGTLSPGEHLMEDLKLWPHYNISSFDRDNLHTSQLRI